MTTLDRESNICFNCSGICSKLEVEIAIFVRKPKELTMKKIRKPTLLLNSSICKANIDRMRERAEISNLKLIPHFKTHQSVKVGEWFRQAGITAITVTSVKMANYFAQDGWSDITIAFPVNVLEVEEINELANEVDLKIFVNSLATVLALKEHLRTDIKFYIEIDTGDGRSGVEAENYAEIANILNATTSSRLKFYGFYSHPGHTYNAGSPAEIIEVSDKVLAKLRNLKDHFKMAFPNLKLALGDTPSCSVRKSFEGIDSIHPGNFVYYDLVQENIGANSFEDIAICLAAPVVALHQERNEVIIHSGWVHQGKDSLKDSEGNIHYGYVVELNSEGWSAPIPEARVKTLSQEHGVLSLPKELLDRIKIGDVIGVLPIHACATVVMMGEVWTLEGERLETMPR